MIRLSHFLKKVGKKIVLPLMLFACLGTFGQANNKKKTIGLPQNKQSANDSILTLEGTKYVELLHGRQAVGNVLQSISGVETKELLSTPASAIIQALPGRIAGLNVSFSSGGPGLDGNGASYSLRGARAQVILIDGVERGYTSIDPEQIESITVLKDALATVMYGQRSSYGIISIKTKKGDRGAPKISMTAQSGIESPLKLPKPLQAWQYATLFNEAKQNDAGLTVVSPAYSQLAIDSLKNGLSPYSYPNVDWYNTILNKTANITRYNFNVQGSGKGFRYFVDLDDLRETGLFKTSNVNSYNTNSQLDRYIVRTNVGVDVTKTTFMQLNLFGRFQKYNQPGGGVGGILTSLLNTPQNAYPVFNPNGTLGGSTTYGQNVNIYGQAVSRGYQFQQDRDIAVDLQVTQKLDVLLPGLYFKAQGSYNNTTYYTTTRTKDFAVYQLLNGVYTKYGTPSDQVSTGAANDRYRVTYLEALLAYDKSFGKHNLNVVAVADQQSKLSFTNGILPENYTSYAGRLCYNYNNRYLLEGAGSYAGYNWASPEKRWSPYWAVGVGWNLQNENFIKNNLKCISNLKLRGTYGLTGQANSGYFTYIQTYNAGAGQGALANNLGPEKAKKLNVGLDLGLAKNRLTLTAEYFFNKFSDLVSAPNTTTAILGTGYPTVNYQKLNYWGSDLSAIWQDKINNFSYFVRANFSFVQSRVVYNGELPLDSNYQKTTGKQVGLQNGYIATGIFKSYDEINDPSVAVPVPKSSLRPGDIRYQDRNNDGVIDNKDIGAIGSGKPTMFYGITLGTSFKGFDFSALIQGTINRVGYINGDFMNGFGNSGANNAYEYNLGRFTTATAATATQPRLWLGSNTNNQLTSTFWIKKNDFVRLKNVEIGYTVPEKASKKIGIPTCRIFINALNLITFAQIYKLRNDIDPEGYGAAYPIMKVVNFGLNIKF